MNNFIEVGSQCWITSNKDSCIAGTILELDSYFCKVKDQYDKEYIVDRKYIYPYAKRVDVVFKRMEEVLKFIKRFEDCNFGNGQYFFSVIMEKRFPNFRTYFVKNLNKFVVCDEDCIYYNEYGRYIPKEHNILIDHKFEYVNNEGYRKEFLEKYFL